jgi:S1-C subfamily serine protease
MLTGPGAVISNVVAGGPAEKAGLKKGDIIESVDGTAIDAANSLSGLITARKVGDSVALSVRTDAQEPRDVKVVLEKNPEKDAPYLGVEYAMVNRRFGQAVPMPWGAPGPMAGVLVSSVAADSPAAKAGLKDQDLITAIEGVPVQSPQSVAKGVAARKPGESLTLTVYRTSEAKEIAIKATLGENPNDKTKGYLGISMSSLPGPGMDFRNWRQPGVAMPAPDPLSKSPGI